MITGETGSFGNVGLICMREGESIIEDEKRAIGLAEERIQVE